MFIHFERDNEQSSLLFKLVWFEKKIKVKSVIFIKKFKIYILYFQTRLWEMNENYKILRNKKQK